MTCRSCGSEKLGNFTSEICIHFPGLRNVDMPGVFVFPGITICLNCGMAQFVIPTAELHLLAKRKTATG